MKKTHWRKIQDLCTWLDPKLLQITRRFGP